MSVEIVLSENIHVSADGYWLEGYHYTDEILVVAFENAAGASYRPDGYRVGWSSAFLRKHRISHLCVKPLRKEWYQGADLAKVFDRLRDEGYFSRYKSVMTYGSSMGGFGALVYADHIGADKVLAFNPQTAMNPETVIFERRWMNVQQACTWDGPFADARGKSQRAKTVILAADMWHSQDKLHIKRILSDNTCIVNVPYLGHGTPTWLARMGLLSNFVLSVVRDIPIDQVEIYSGLRRRRYYEEYYKQLLSKSRVRNSKKFRIIVRAARNKLRAAAVENAEINRE